MFLAAAPSRQDIRPASIRPGQNRRLTVHSVILVTLFPAPTAKNTLANLEVNRVKVATLLQAYTSLWLHWFLTSAFVSRAECVKRPRGRGVRRLCRGRGHDGDGRHVLSSMNDPRMIRE